MAASSSTTTSNRPQYKLFVKTIEAYAIKSLSEVLQSMLTDVCFRADKTGIRLLALDEKTPATMLVDLKLHHNKFDEYECKEPVNIGINLQHLHRLIKVIKKKDQLELFIDKNYPDRLGITIIVHDTRLRPTCQLQIQKIMQMDSEVPTGYGHPIHISTSSYQKMCKDMGNISKEITVFSKKSYLEFRGKMDKIFDKKYPFGEEPADSNNNDDEFEDVYSTKNLVKLIKVPGLDQKMYVYTPLVSSETDNPLKISVGVGRLGELNVYIKSLAQIGNSA